MHIMLDIETLDTKPTAAILAIGAIAFDPVSQTISDSFYRAVDLQSCLDLGLTINADTIAWWMTQSDAARAVFAERGSYLAVVLRDLTNFAGDATAVWSHGASFDCVIVENAYAATRLVCPWHYRQVRCSRTLCDLAGLKMSDFAEGVAHNALTDARNQARAVIAGYRKLGLCVDPLFL